ncbi:Ras-like protein Rab-7a, partial [Sphaeroforma arctica JP610]
YTHTRSISYIHTHISPASMSQRKVLLKVIILGNSGVGKTAIMNRYINKKFNPVYKATIGADFLTKEVNIDGQAITLQIWDTAGQERFQSLGVAFYRGADCCILVYDVTVAATFDSLSMWKEEFLAQAGIQDDGTFPIYILGNKSDLPDHQVTEEDYMDWSQENGNLPHFITSAKDDVNVQKAFEAIAKSALEQELDMPLPPTNEYPSVRLDTREEKKDGCGC